MVQWSQARYNWYLVLERRSIYKSHVVDSNYNIISLTRSPGFQDAPRYQTHKAITESGKQGYYSNTETQGHYIDTGALAH